MDNIRSYKRGLDFPNEGFIQDSIEKYFIKLGYKQLNEKFSDFACVNSNTEEKWIIEAKGKTKAIGLDFRTCLGQLIQRMDSRDTHYGIAVPNLTQYINQCRMVKRWIRNELNLYWLFVDKYGNVEVFEPDKEL
ncbi:hypothetical protein [Ruminiclostridium josui]|uniref:hypothetical protein n=1 Tax=Ruminiclostridium josui TaxID=1499 RepID=UPI000464AC5C|nr:hypothetical protein [Ruminiclostridium josui]